MKTAFGVPKKVLRVLFLGHVYLVPTSLLAAGNPREDPIDRVIKNVLGWGFFVVLIIIGGAIYKRLKGKKTKAKNAKD